MKKFSHRPVMLARVIKSLAIKPDGIYIDATFGRGGHASAILEKLGEGGKLLAFDQDPEAVSYGASLFGNDTRFRIEHLNFRHVADVVEQQGLKQKIDGVLMDIGVSSPQFDDAQRGFSFNKSGPLDMRMNPQQGLSASEWLQRSSKEEIVTTLKRYGEEKFARRIASAIVNERQEKPITDTLQLASIVSDAIPVKEKNKHPATRTFQALRIVVNDELAALEQTLKDMVHELATGGRLVVISFHSLEDRITKRFMRDCARGVQLPPEIPVTGQVASDYRVVGKALRADDEEINENIRARSAVLRTLECVR